MKSFTTHSGKIHKIDRADINTDHIIPKQFLKRVERSGFGDFLFYEWVQSNEINLNQEATILVTGRNFGCGSSREHAPWVLQDFGFKVIIAASFADIFYTNCIKIGLLPITLSEIQLKTLMNGDEVTVDLNKQVVSFQNGEHRFDIDVHIKQHLLNGLDDIALTNAYKHKIQQFEQDYT